MKNDSTKRILLSVGNGLEGITIYTSDNEGVIDWCSSLPALYLEASVQGATVKLGPFFCSSIRESITQALQGPSGASNEQIAAKDAEIARLRMALQSIERKARLGWSDLINGSSSNLSGNEQITDALKKICSIPLGPDKGSAQSQIDCAVAYATAALQGFKK